MVSFTETAAVEWAPSGVRVNAVAPGWIASSGMDTYPEWMHRFLRLLALAVPLQRLGTESETSAAICFLLLAGGGVHLGRPARRRRGAERQAGVAASAMVPDAERRRPRVASRGRSPAHDRAPKPWNGFHLAVTPRVLRDD